MMDFLFERVQAFPPGTLFTLKGACGDHWNTLSHGERRSRGKDFRWSEARERICVPAGKGSGRVQQYLKT
jgi:hypothetical protein